MSLRTKDITSVATLKTYLDISGTTQDSLLELLIKSVTDLVQSYCNRAFVQIAYTQEEYDGTGTKELLLNNYPIKTSAGFTLERNVATNNSDSWETVDAEDYFVDAERGIVTKLTNFWQAKNKYRVTYTAGYDKTADTTILAWPADLELACINLAAILYTRRKAMGIKNESVGDFSVTFSDALEEDPSIKTTLDKYKRYVL